MGINKLPRNEVSKCEYTGYDNSKYFVSYNELTAVFTLYKYEKDNSFTKVQSHKTPDEYDKFIYSKGKPPKIVDYVEDDKFENVLVYSTVDTLKTIHDKDIITSPKMDKVSDKKFSDDRSSKEKAKKYVDKEKSKTNTKDKNTKKKKETKDLKSKKLF